MMERFGRGVVMSWRENNIKTEKQGGEGRSRTGSRKVRFGSASVGVRVRKNISRRNKKLDLTPIKIYIDGYESSSSEYDSDVDPEFNPS
ncbi:hypothetical protein J6590_041440 [Homalodisca vitripennis]|nr:hypothetical protein J6590_041440 [Homalodisca vitripennis]